MISLQPPWLSLRQFITYKAILDEKTGKWDKQPTDPKTNELINALDPRFWVTYEQARATEHPIGFVLTEDDPYFCIDIDGCLQPNMEWSPDSLTVVNSFPGAMVEMSMSGQGLHIWGRYRAPIPDHACRNASMGLELYHTKRFIALGQPGATGDRETDCTQPLEAAILKWFPPGAASGAVVDWTEVPVREWTGPLEDDDLIAKACRSGSAGAVFGNKATFKDLWEANETVLSNAYPSKTGQPYDASSADMALAAHLSFWTGRNCERMKRLMLASGLKRDKWEREEYLTQTILRGARQAKEVFTSRAVEETGEEKPSEPVPLGIVWPEQQVKLFEGCVYVLDEHVVQLPGGRLLKPEQFKAKFGGRSFPYTRENDKLTKDAWEAFTQSQVVEFPKVDSTCFRPHLAPGAVIEHDDMLLVNTYWPVKTPRKSGDATRFLMHLAKVLPHEHDRQIFLAYMAAIVQYPGVKFKWAPFLQGAPGNGKTLFSECIANAVGRRYSHLPKATEISSKFNLWMYGTLFIGVEDIYVPERREDVMEALKPMITGEWLEIEGKGGNQVTREICCNFIINSNHKAGWRKSKNDRRIAPFFSAQQSAADIAQDGMGGYYFPDLYRWLREEGYAIVNDYLHRYAIPDELNPAMFCHRAPDTTSTLEAVEVGMGRIEQEVLEAIEQGLHGFRGGWINSDSFDDLLKRIRADQSLPYARRRDVLRELGYDWHPGLLNGRVSNPLTDGRKPKLFLKVGHLAGNLRGSALLKAYYDAQAPATGAGVFGQSQQQEPAL